VIPRASNPNRYRLPWMQPCGDIGKLALRQGMDRVPFVMVVCRPWMQAAELSCGNTQPPAASRFPRLSLTAWFISHPATASFTRWTLKRESRCGSTPKAVPRPWRLPMVSARFATKRTRCLEEQDHPALTPRVRLFVLYSLRHTFLTRLGASGCDVWTLARIAGHGSVGISARYVHPSEDAVLSAVEKLGGHKTGHDEEGSENQAIQQELLTA
jgi:hypothetical protein